MNRMMKPAIAAIAVMSLAFTVASTPWTLKDEHYAVTFTSKRVDGGFTGLKTNIGFDENNLQGSRITATIEAATVKTGNSLRDKHARQGLDDGEYPTIRFECPRARGTKPQATLL